MGTTTRRGGAHARRDAEPASRSVDQENPRPVTRERFGGTDLPAAFAGTMAAIGMLTLLGAVASAWSNAYGQNLSRDEVISPTGATVALVIIGLSGLFGGWVTGRASRYTGTANGLLTGLLLIAAAAAIGWLLGSQSDGDSGFSMPSWVSAEATTDRALVAAAIAAAIALAAAALGGALGTFWHRRVDRSLVAETAQDTEPDPYPEEQRLVPAPTVDESELNHDTADTGTKTPARSSRKRSSS